MITKDQMQAKVKAEIRDQMLAQAGPPTAHGLAWAIVNAAWPEVHAELIALQAERDRLAGELRARGLDHVNTRGTA